ncbi:hypothetical protein [Streptomyces sp. NPDC048612]|uniref:WXG100 family type VII secretion target n=1 Tax=Streptomyces sp. NPDC048612 TaxID=3365579 RepID=UPI0037248682
MAGNNPGLGIPGCTNFENASHQALYAMVADSDHMQIGLMGTALVDAGKEIAEITKDLEAYVDQVRWQGDGATAFRNWTAATATESRKLSHYARTTGEAMVDAAGALGQARLMPRPPEPKNSVEVDSGKVSGFDALRKNPERDEAVTEMNRLASYYRTAQQKIASQEPPNFQPASGFVPEPKPTDGYSDQFSLLEDPAGARSVHGSGGTATAPSTDSSTGTHQGGASPSAPHETRPDQQTGTSLDSTAPVVTPDAPPPHRDSLPQDGGSRDVPGLGIPGWKNPPGSAEAPTRQEGRRSPEPERGRPGTSQRRHGRAVGDGVIGPTRRGGGEADRAKLPRGTVMGEEPHRTAPGPVGARDVPAASPSRTPGEGTGRTGQYPGSLRREPLNRPGGPVTGEKGGPVPQGMAGGGSPGTTTSVSPRGMGTQGARGRRWAYELGGPVGTGSGAPVVGGEQRSATHGSGGTVGGTALGRPSGTSSVPAPAPGAMPGQARAARSQPSDFTSGGSGLTRSNPSRGALPVPGSPSSSRRRGPATQRPEYLQEESETWTAQRTSVVPPVIE